MNAPIRIVPAPLPIEADMYLHADPYSLWSLQDIMQVILTIQGDEELIMFILPTFSPSLICPITCYGWLSVVQSACMTRTNISKEQRELLIDLALIFRAFTEYPDLEDNYWRFVGALVEAAMGLDPYERADSTLRDLIAAACEALPLHIFEDTNVPALEHNDLVPVPGADLESNVGIIEVDV
ncbi:hypothetical protein BD311DRAFT_741126 [Dichomitus squalens]|uniref:Uncharacterized protein n=1 Tax=Dichomitus squalens TaxID=114155 RepID=A0A4Q9ME22_9APHY|nr:hypothetical protein BD311DRAFT_741126 [Dichomitus squalens]